MNSRLSKDIIAEVQYNLINYELFMDNVVDFFLKHPSLSAGNPPTVHSVKCRIKSLPHIIEKITRKGKTRKVTAQNVCNLITDIAGVRVLHLFQDQFKGIHQAIVNRIDDGNWVLVEPPMACTWDPETETKFIKMGLKTEYRPTYYTSVHYLVKPNPDTKIKCEIQVRTLFEEAWGEIDHAINYPKPTQYPSCKDQIKVLAKLVATGTHLSDSIIRTYALESGKPIGF